MQCEIRKSGNLRDVVYLVGKLGDSTAVVFIDTVESKPAESLVGGPRRKFWQDMMTVYREVGQASIYTLEEDVKEYRMDVSRTSPIIIEVDLQHMLPGECYNGLIDRLKNLDFRHIMVICVICSTKDEVEVREFISSRVALKNKDSLDGIDILAIIHDDEEAGFTLLQ